MYLFHFSLSTNKETLGAILLEELLLTDPP